MKARSDGADRRLIVLQQSGKTKVTVPAAGRDVLLTELLNDPQQASNLLSKTCLSIFNGDHKLRPLARQLDVLAYGAELCPFEDVIADALEQSQGKVVEDPRFELHHRK